MVIVCFCARSDSWRIKIFPVAKSVPNGVHFIPRGRE
jgi:hypothetical protein